MSTAATTTDPVAAAWASVEALAASSAQLAELLASVPERVQDAAKQAPDARAEFVRMATTSLRRRLDALREALATDLADLADACRPPHRRRAATPPDPR